LPDEDNFEFPPILKERIYEIMNSIERNETDFKDNLNKSWSVYSKEMKGGEDILASESFKLGFFMAYMEQYYRQLTYTVFQKDYQLLTSLTIFSK
jgi:hypothetical protein